MNPSRSFMKRPEAWYERWFSKPKKGKGKIFILNKGRCGNGGTTGFINYARKNCKGLLVSVPKLSKLQGQS